MAVILGYEIAEDWFYYESSISSDVQKWWKCPRCAREFLFKFNSQPPWPPTSLFCPSCRKDSPIPWPSPPMVSWKCEVCGTVQTVSRRCWESPNKEYTEISFDGSFSEDTQILQCITCTRFAPTEPVSGVIGAAIDVVGGVIGAVFDVVGELSGWKEEDKRVWTRLSKEAEEAERAFDGFLRKVPDIRAEQARLAEEERQRAALEAKKRQKELRLLKKQARTATGLKQMEPTNFELAVASLYLTLGYKVYVTPTSGDQGIDLVAVKDKERIAVQCKRYQQLVPVSQVRDFYGSFVGTYTRGIFVTSSAFSRATRNWIAERQRLELVDGQQLAKLFVQHDPKIISNFEKWKEQPPDAKNAIQVFI